MFWFLPGYAETEVTSSWWNTGNKPGAGRFGPEILTTCESVWPHFKIFVSHCTRADGRADRWTHTNHFSGYFRPCETYGGIGMEERTGALNTLINLRKIKRTMQNSLLEMISPHVCREDATLETHRMIDLPFAGCRQALLAVRENNHNTVVSLANQPAWWKKNPFQGNGRDWYGNAM